MKINVLFNLMADGELIKDYPFFKKSFALWNVY